MMTIRGFFSKSDLLNMGIDLEGPKCEECGLYKNCHSPKMKYTGKGKKQVLIIALAPGAVEDMQGEQLVGDSGQLLRNKLALRGLDLDQDFWKINAINCRPHKGNKNVDPTEKQLRCCHPLVKQTIQTLKPKVIWLFGEQALRSFYMDRSTEAPMVISTWRGLCIPDKEYNVWAVPMYHPSYLLRKQEDRISESVFDRDLDFAISCLQKESVSFIEVANKVQGETKFEAVQACLKEICNIRPSILSFDYETSGAKPYKQNHKIATISLCYNSSQAFSFPFQYRNMWSNNQLNILKTLWAQILRDPKIKKCAHGLNFEDLWSRHKIGTSLNGKHWCTKLAAHVLDNRKGFSGLKFQGRLKWGLENWGEEVKSFLKSTDEKGFNRVDEIPLDKLLLYNGIDSLVEHWLVEEQKKEFKKFPSLFPAYQFFLNSQSMLTNAQDNGINIDMDYYKKSREVLQEEINEKEKSIRNNRDIKEFEKIKGRSINVDSSKDLRLLFFDILKLESSKFTKTELESVDESSLEELDSPLAKDIISLRKIKKIRNTYMAQFMREVGEDGRLHPFFPLHNVVSLRGASSSPNFQNIPVRDEEAKKWVRSGIIPSPGNILLDWDYGSQEVRIAACYTKDPVLIAYINNPQTDMHRDEACALFCLSPKNVTKNLRYFAKNGFVFPQFYGSYWGACAKKLFAECMDLKTEEGQLIKDHLYSVGIIKNENSAYKDFENHVRDVEDEFWKKFKVFRQCQDKWVEDFIKKGYIELFQGFRCSGYLNKNRIINYRIQGVAFHCILYTLKRVEEKIKREKWKTKIIGEIHDSGVYDSPPEEEKNIINITNYYGIEKIREHFPWLIVPLTIEWSKTEVNGSWYSKKEIENEYTERK